MFLQIVWRCFLDSWFALSSLGFPCRLLFGIVLSCYVLSYVDFSHLVLHCHLFFRESLWVCFAICDFTLSSLGFLHRFWFCIVVSCFPLSFPLASLILHCPCFHVSYLLVLWLCGVVSYFLLSSFVFARCACLVYSDFALSALVLPCRLRLSAVEFGIPLSYLVLPRRLCFSYRLWFCLGVSGFMLLVFSLVVSDIPLLCNVVSCVCLVVSYLHCHIMFCLLHVLALSSLVLPW